MDDKVPKGGEAKNESVTYQNAVFPYVNRKAADSKGALQKHPGETW